MNLLCLCPTYGRKPELINNTIQLFQRQTYPADKRFLLLLDDGKTYRPSKGPNWEFVNHPERLYPLGRKYNVMWQDYGHRFMDWDAVCIWEDDDLYLPHHCEVSAETLRRHAWSKPSHVWSTYKGLDIENAAGRFHASMSIRRDCLEEVGGWVDTMARNFDQQFMANLHAYIKPGIPRDSDTNPSYVFRWGDTGHQHQECIAQKDDNKLSEYENYPIHRHPQHEQGMRWTIEPQLDAAAVGVFRKLGLEV